MLEVRRLRDLDPLDVPGLRAYADTLAAGCERERARIRALEAEHARLGLTASERSRRAYVTGVVAGAVLSLASVVGVGFLWLFR